MRTWRKLFYWLTALLSFFSTPKVAFAAVVSEPEGYATLDQLMVVFNNLISVVAVVGGFLSFMALIVGGFRYLTSRGDPKAVASAQGILTYAILGLVMIIVSWLLLKFVAAFTGLDELTRFCLGPCPN